MHNIFHVLMDINQEVVDNINHHHRRYKKNFSTIRSILLWLQRGRSKSQLRTILFFQYVVLLVIRTSTTIPPKIIFPPFFLIPQKAMIFIYDYVFFLFENERNQEALKELRSLILQSSFESLCASMYACFFLPPPKTLIYLLILNFLQSCERF